jgi:uncharacterized protein
MQTVNSPKKHMETDDFEQLCKTIYDQLTAGKGSDSAHDLSHILRVVATAKKILKSEKADEKVVIAAAWLHDCVMLPKNHPDRNRSSGLAAKKAAEMLEKEGFRDSMIAGIVHAIEAHSYSAEVAPETIEAKIVQDADRLDALGAVGIARCFMVGGKLDRPPYNPDDPFCKHRNPDDQKWTLDHFYTKLFRLPETMHTESAKKIALERVAFMNVFLGQMQKETG